MDIGIPRERALAERRVALTPAGVGQLTRRGHRVFIECSAGDAARWSDGDYVAAGASLAYEADEVFGRGELLLKVSPPTLEEYEMLTEGQILMCHLRPAVAPPRGFAALLDRRISAVAAELIEDARGDAPVLRALSEIAGPMSIQIAAHLLQSDAGGRGILLGGAPGIPPATVVILGAGVVGATAARAASGIGAHVVLLDRDVGKLRHIEEHSTFRVATMFSDAYNRARAMRFADVLIGAVMIRGDRTPQLVTEEMVSRMKPGSVVVDVSIDQGGCLETSRPTTIDQPTYLRHGVVHYAVPNLTANVARSATYAYTHASIPYVLEIAGSGLTGACVDDAGLRRGLIVSDGRCFRPAVASRFQVPVHDPVEILSGTRSPA